MNKYVQRKRFNSEQQLEVYMYALIHVDFETISVEYHFPDTKTFFVNYKKMSTPGTVLKHWLGFL